MYYDAKKPSIYYRIDDNTLISIGFGGYKKLNLHCGKNSGGKKRMTITMLTGFKYPQYGNTILMEKNIHLWSKDYYFVTKFRKILLSMNRNVNKEKKIKYELDKKRQLDESYTESERLYKSKMEMIPKSYKRENIIDGILNDK